MLKGKSPRRFLKIFILVFIGIIFIPSIVGITKALISCNVWKIFQKSSPNNFSSLFSSELSDIKDYYRSEDLTYLTLPEWYVVYSTDEYADFISNNSPSNFPHLGSIRQYWRSYNETCNVVKDKYPFNTSYQFVLGFIGVSFTGENMIKGLYESTVGKITELTMSTPTDEDLFAAKTAKEYGEFLHSTPWYFFPFGEKVRNLWTETHLWGKSPIRKWERKLVLTAEYGGKYLYSGFTKLGSKLTYGGEDTNKIYAITKGVERRIEGPDIELVKSLENGYELTRFTRFETFNNTLKTNINNGLTIVEMAGNDEILVTLLANKDGEYTYQNGEYLYDLPILTVPYLTRIAVNVKLEKLPAFFSEITNSTDRLEHIYDY